MSDQTTTRWIVKRPRWCIWSRTFLTEDAAWRAVVGTGERAAERRAAKIAEGWIVKEQSFAE